MKLRYERRGGGDFEFLYGVAFPTAGRNAREKRGEAGTTRRLIGMQGSLQLGTLPTAAEDTEKKSTSPLLAGLLGTTSAWISIGSQAWLWSRFSGLSVCLAHILRCAVVQYCLNVVSDEVKSWMTSKLCPESSATKNGATSLASFDVKNELNSFEL
jgi:hypothetical protein